MSAEDLIVLAHTVLFAQVFLVGTAVSSFRKRRSNRQERDSDATTTDEWVLRPPD